MSDSLFAPPTQEELKSVSDNTFAPPTDQEYKNYSKASPADLQDKAIGALHGAAEGVVPGLTNLLSYGKTLGQAAGSAVPSETDNEEPFDFGKTLGKNEKDIEGYFKSKEDKAPILSGAAKIGGQLMAGPAEIAAAKRLMGAAPAVREGGALVNTIGEGTNPISGVDKFKALLAGIGRGTAEGAAVGGAYGAANAPGNIIENTGNVANAALNGAKFGATLGGGASALGEGLANTLTNTKMSKAFQEGTQGNGISGIPANLRSGAATQGAAETATQNTMQPLEAANNIYKAELDNATNEGKVVDTTPELEKNSSDALNLYKTKAMTNYHEKLLNGSLTPTEAKEYQNLVTNYLGSEQKNPQVNQLNIEALKGLKGSLNNAIDTSLPPDRLNKINQIYSDSRKGVETLLNNGVENPSFQSESVSDYNPGELKPALMNKFKSDIIPNVLKNSAQASQGPQTTLNNFNASAQRQQGSINDTIDKVVGEENGSDLGNIYGQNKADYNVPDSIKKIENAGALNNVTGAGVGNSGEQSVGREVGAATKIASGTGALTGMLGTTGYKAANMAGQAVGIGGGTRAVADKLSQSPIFGNLGKGLNDALDNPGNSATNAALMKIMQNPGARKAAGIDIGKSDDNNGISDNSSNSNSQ